MSEFNYRITVLGAPVESGNEEPVDPEAIQQDGHAFVTLPFDADAKTLLEVALEHVGIYWIKGFEIESDDTGGFIIRDLDGEPMLSLQLEVEDESEPGDDLYRSYGQYDDDVGLPLD